MIICAAIKLIIEEQYDTKLEKPKELVICGYRHEDCWEIISHLDARWFNTKKTQGFINHRNEFLDRREAFIHAWDCGQLSETHRLYQEENRLSELYSEDLY